METQKIINAFFKANKITGRFNPNDYAKPSKDILKILIKNNLKIFTEGLTCNNLSVHAFLIPKDKYEKRSNDNLEYLILFISLEKDKLKIEPLSLDLNFNPVKKNKSSVFLYFTSQKLKSNKKDNEKYSTEIIIEYEYSFNVKDVSLLNNIELNSLILNSKYDESINPKSYLLSKTFLEKQNLTNFLDPVNKKNKNSFKI